MLQKRDISHFHTRLHAWYATQGRHALPWRQTRDPYPIWLSEVMLQQTQVSTVLARYYYPFLQKFPTVQALAAAERQDVMKAWEGLGYYRRAGFLHEAAKQVAAVGGWQHFGEVEKLTALPGIGRNTAHAVASFGFGIPVPVMEANLKRVLARIFAWETPTDKQLWDAAFQLLDEKNAFDYNQAMMDVGAMVCTPRKPACMLCPANEICKGRKNPEMYPAAKAKKEKPVRQSKLLLIYTIDADGTRRYAMSPRETALLGGLYGFPQVSSESNEWVFEGRKIPLSAADSLGEISHAFTHFRMDCVVLLLSSKAGQTLSNGFYSTEEITQLPIAAIDKKALALLRNA